MSDQDDDNCIPIEVSDAQILAALRLALFKFATSGAQSYTIHGRTFMRAEIDKIQSLISQYETRVLATSSPGLNGQTILARTNSVAP